MGKEEYKDLPIVRSSTLEKDDVMKLIDDKDYMYEWDGNPIALALSKCSRISINGWSN